MKFSKAVFVSSLAVACSLAATSAFAAKYTSGGSDNGTTYLVGPTILTSGSNSVPCTSKFQLQVTGGVAKVTGATFTGGGLCGSLTTNLPGSPWTIAPPTSDAGPNNVTISGISVTVPAPISKTCTGSITGTLNNSGQFTFSGTLTPLCNVSSRAALTNVDTTVTPNVTYPIADAVYP